MSEEEDAKAVSKFQFHPSIRKPSSQTLHAHTARLQPTLDFFLGISEPALMPGIVVTSIPMLLVTLKNNNKTNNNFKAWEQKSCDQPSVSNRISVSNGFFFFFW